MFGWRNWEYGLDGMITPLMRVPLATNGPHLSTSHFFLFLFIFFSPLSSSSARREGGRLPRSSSGPPPPAFRHRPRCAAPDGLHPAPRRWPSCAALAEASTPVSSAFTRSGRRPRPTPPCPAAAAVAD